MNRIVGMFDWISRILFDMYADELGFVKIMHFIKRNIRRKILGVKFNISSRHWDMLFGLLIFIWLVAPFGVMYYYGFFTWHKFNDLGLLRYLVAGCLYWFGYFYLIAIGLCIILFPLLIAMSIYFKLFEWASDTCVVYPVKPDGHSQIDVSDDIDKALSLYDGTNTVKNLVILFVTAELVKELLAKDGGNRLNFYDALSIEDGAAKELTSFKGYKICLPNLIELSAKSAYYLSNCSAEIECRGEIYDIIMKFQNNRTNFWKFNTKV